MGRASLPLTPLRRLCTIPPRMGWTGLFAEPGFIAERSERT
jgi:hypothetical protein